MLHKIYSRPRLKIPKKVIHTGRKLQTNKARKMSMMTIILIIAFSTVKLTLDAVFPIFDTLCENRAKSIATIISNEQATNVMKEHSYDELFSIDKDNEGNITMIKTNVIPINEIISDVAVKIQNEIDNRGKEDIEIAMRKFHRF